MVAADMPAHIKKVRNMRLRSKISTAIGKPIKPAKGQPNKADMATKNIAKGYFWVHQAAKAEQPKYMANEEGNKAVLDINMPTLNSWNISHKRPICMPNS